MARTSAGRSPALRDLALLVARIVVGVVFMAHGWQKIGQNGIAATAQGFSGMGIPKAQIAAPAVAYSELIGGALLVLGALTPVAGVVLAVVMLVAALVVHLPAGLFVQQGGWELVAVLGAAALALGLGGPGRYSLDHAAGRKRGRRHRAPVHATA